MTKKRQELVATKISSEAWLRLNDIAQKMGLTPYRLIQEMIDTIILYMDQGRQLDPDMQMLIDCFERFEGWGELCRLTDINVNWAVFDAIYFCHDDRSKGTAGMVACWHKKGYMTRSDYSFNKKDILDIVVKRLFPDLYRELQLLAMQSNTNGVLDTMKACIHQLLQDPDKETLREMFADCGRTNYGASTDLVKYVRHNRKNMEVPDKREKPLQLDLFSDELACNDNKNIDD